MVSLLLLPASWTLGLAVALHVADGHHDAALGDDRDAEPRGIALAFHGHSHDAGTPAHDHPVVRSGAVSATTRVVPPVVTSVGQAALVDTYATARRLVALADSAHDPPRRPPAPLPLRI